MSYVLLPAVLKAVRIFEIRQTTVFLLGVFAFFFMAAASSSIDTDSGAFFTRVL